MKAYEWIELLKAKKGWESDYKAAQELGLSRAALSNYKSGKRQTFDEPAAVKVAILLGERPEALVLDQFAEQAKNPSVRTALLAEARRLCILCLITSARLVVAVHPFPVSRPRFLLPN